MPSAARADFEVRVEVVDRIVEAHGLLGRRHRPALINAGIIFLAAATEAFVEELFEEAARAIFTRMTPRQFDTLFRATSERLHTANVLNTELLYFNLGMPGALAGVSWRRFSNERLREDWDA